MPIAGQKSAGGLHVAAATAALFALGLALALSGGVAGSLVSPKPDPIVSDRRMESAPPAKTGELLLESQDQIDRETVKPVVRDTDGDG